MKNLIFLACAFVLSPGVIGAQNMMSNPRFDTDLTSWSSFVSSAPDPVTTGTLTWQALQDVNGYALSGSAGLEFDGSPTLANAAYGMRQCLDLTAQQPVTQAAFGMRFIAPVQAYVDGDANVTVEAAFFSDTACTPGNLMTAGSQGKTVTTADLGLPLWFTSEMVPPSGFIIAPLSSPMSVEVRCFIRGVSSTAGPFSVFVDNVFFAVNGAVPVELLSFEVE